MRRLAAGVLMLYLLQDSAGAQTLRADPAPDASGKQGETYKSAEIDANGALRIVTSDGRTIVFWTEGDQSSFGTPTISADRSAVGAEARYPNCCTSYDIPLQLVIYANGNLHRLRGNGLPIFQWHFADEGTRVAYGQEPVHFGCETHYELRDIRTERLIAAADVPQPCGLRPDPPQRPLPGWVRALNAARR